MKKPLHVLFGKCYASGLNPRNEQNTTKLIVSLLYWYSREQWYNSYSVWNGFCAFLGWGVQHNILGWGPHLVTQYSGKRIPWNTKHCTVLQLKAVHRNTLILLTLVYTLVHLASMFSVIAYSLLYRTLTGIQYVHFFYTCHYSTYTSVTHIARVCFRITLCPQTGTDLIIIVLACLGRP